MRTKTPQHTEEQLGEDFTGDPWPLLRALTMFRLLSCVFFVAAPFLPATQTFVQYADRMVLLEVGVLYSIASLCMAALYLWRKPQISTQVPIQIYVDIVFVTLLMQQLGGVSSGVGVLLCAPLSATALLPRSGMSYLYAAVATIAILGQTLYTAYFVELGPEPNFTLSAVLCIAMFVIAALCAQYNNYRSASSALIEDQQQKLVGLQSLSEEILSNFDHGLLAITAEGYIAHSNPSALRLLGAGTLSPDESIAEAIPQLQRFISSGARQGTVRIDYSTLYVTAKHIDGGVTLLTLVSKAEHDIETNQLKLAALGQWTASVAHEIRNPLSAIQQAAQLLEEAPNATPQQQTLHAMVVRNSERIDHIVTDILNLAKPSQALTATELEPWLQEIAVELRQLHGLEETQLLVRGSSDICADIDKNKMRHVVENLCKNSIVHGGDLPITINIDVSIQNGLPLIRVSDNGNGIAEHLRPHLFEPFYTNASTGTGLGLFIAREICAQNRIILEDIPSNTGAAFRLQFSDSAIDALPTTYQEAA